MNLGRTLVSAALTAMFCAGCAFGGGLSGTTWKGGNILDSNVVFTFSSGSGCSVSTSFMGSGPCTYTYSDGQAVLTYNGQKYVFNVQGSQMQGNLLGAGVQLVKQ